MDLLELILSILAFTEPAKFSLRETCDKKDLCYKSTNIACENIRLCQGGKMIEFSTTEKQHIADVYNKLRNELAMGNISGYERAARMGTMVWDDELATMVDLNIRRCVYGHDQCHNTANYPQSGQNLAYVKGYGHGTFNRSAVVKEFDTMIGDWFHENKNANMNMMRKFQNNGEVVTHFTGMSIDKNVRVGCAGVWYPEDNTGRVNFGCNFADLTIFDSPVYIDGPTASKCTTGTNKKFPGLCSANEKY